LLIIPNVAFSENRFSVFTKDMGDALARYLLTGTKLENSLPKREEKPTVLKFEISNSTSEVQDFGYLKISSQYNSEIKLNNKDTKETYTATIKKNQPQEIKIKKGIYTADMNFNGRKKTTSISFLGSKGEFEIK
jgi:pectin methylesterase-like acyl-CoA thioesterase